MHPALTKVGVPAPFIRMEGAGHEFPGSDIERANAAMVQWLEQHLGSAAKQASLHKELRLRSAEPGQAFRPDGRLKK